MMLTSKRCVLFALSQGVVLCACAEGTPLGATMDEGGGGAVSSITTPTPTSPNTDGSNSDAEIADAGPMALGGAGGGLGTAQAGAASGMDDPSFGAGGAAGDTGGVDGDGPDGAGGDTAEGTGGETSGGAGGETSDLGGAGGSDDGGGTSDPDPYEEPAVILIDNVVIHASSNGNVWNLYHFSNGTDGFILNPYGSTPEVGFDVGAEELSALSTLSTDGNQGLPAPALRGEVPFSSTEEQVDFTRPLDGLEFNLTGYHVHADIRLLGGGPSASACPLQAWLFATSTNGSYFFISSASVEIDAADDWVSLTLDLANPTGEHSNGNFDITRVNQIGVQVHSGNGSCP